MPPRAVRAGDRLSARGGVRPAVVRHRLGSPRRRHPSGAAQDGRQDGTAPDRHPQPGPDSRPPRHRTPGGPPREPGFSPIDGARERKAGGPTRGRPVHRGRPGFSPRRSASFGKPRSGGALECGRTSDSTTCAMRSLQPDGPGASATIRIAVVLGTSAKMIATTYGHLTTDDLRNISDQMRGDSLKP